MANDSTYPSGSSADLSNLGSKSGGSLPSMSGKNASSAPVAPMTVPSAASQVTTASGINIPAPPPPGVMPNTVDMNNVNPTANQLAQQAEEAALQAQAEQAAQEQEHIRKSYDRASNGLLPLSPDQIRDFMHRLEDTQKAAQPPSSGQPKGNVKLVTLSLDPGVDPPQINLAAGYVTTITLVDATGQPWPILDAAVGGNFEVSPTQASTHVVRIMPLTRVGTGNLSLVLKELSTPIIFRLTAGGPTVDLRYDARVPKLGPGAKAPLIDRPHLEAGDENIIMLLDNAPPANAKRMKVNGLDARTMAWMIDNHVFLRTPLTLLSPAWNASVSSADGMTVYEIGDAPVLLMSDNGAVVRARLMRDDDHDK